MTRVINEQIVILTEFFAQNIESIDHLFAGSICQQPYSKAVFFFQNFGDCLSVDDRGLKLWQFFVCSVADNQGVIVAVVYFGNMRLPKYRDDRLSSISLRVDRSDSLLALANGQFAFRAECAIRTNCD